jgi:hypothetical protein
VLREVEMPRHIWSVLCAKSSTDRETNNISLFEVIEQINVQIPPGVGDPGVIAISLELVTLWRRQDAETAERATARLVHLEADGSEANSAEFSVDLTRHRRMRTISKIGGLPVRRPGTHVLKVELQRNDNGWDPVAWIPVEVNVTAADEVAEPAAEPDVIH